MDLHDEEGERLARCFIVVQKFVCADVWSARLAGADDQHFHAIREFGGARDCVCSMDGCGDGALVVMGGRAVFIVLGSCVQCDLTP